MRAWSVVLILLFLTACSAVPKEYQVGDGTRYLLGLQDDYCNKGNLIAKKMLLVSVRTVYPKYPEDGVCTDMMATVITKLETPTP